MRSRSPTSGPSTVVQMRWYGRHSGRPLPRCATPPPTEEAALHRCPQTHPSEISKGGKGPRVRAFVRVCAEVLAVVGLAAGAVGVWAASAIADVAPVALNDLATVINQLRNTIVGLLAGLAT